MLESVLENGHGCSPKKDVWHCNNVVSPCKTNSETSLPSTFSTLQTELLLLFEEKQTKRIALLLIFCLICYFVLLAWSTNSCSMALLAYTYTVGFNLLSLLTCILSVWVERQNPTPLFSFGYERFEVLAIFASTVLAQLASLFIIKESIERLVLEQQEVHTGRLLVGASIAFICHIIVIYGCNNSALAHVVAASSSSWLQEHVSDISQSICSVLPMLSGLLLPRVNPMLLIACAGGFSLVVTDFLIEIKNCYVADTLAAICTSLMMCGTMLPMSVYSGKVLLQTTPSHIVGQLDKCLRETLTIDGVLEFRNEHFWTLSFGKMAGSLQVRVRRDANEQMVLAHVYDRLSSVVSVLTIQVFKDEWAMRRGVGNIVSSPLPPLPNHSSFLSNHVVNSPTTSIVSVNMLPTTVSHGNSWLKGSNSPAREMDSLSSPLASHLFSSQTNISNLRHPLSSSSQNLSTLSLSVQPVNHVIKSPSLSNVSFQGISPDFSSPRFSKPNSIPDKTPRKTALLPNVSLPVATIPQPSQANNLLISGARTLDAERFTYKPR